MKYIKIIFLLATLLVTSFAISSCGSSSTNTEKQGKEYTAAYICPMHCEGSGSETAGTCPVCGMDYEANKDHKADSHTH